MVYEIKFKADLTEDDVRAMKKCFFDAMNESMDIYSLWGLELEKIDGTEDDEDNNNENGKLIPFAKVYEVVQSWFSFMDEEDLETTAQDFAIGLSKGRDCWELLKEVCDDCGLDFAEFEGICPELEELIGE